MGLKISDSGAINVLPSFAFDLTVGVHEEDGGARHGNGPLTVVQVAAISEFGSSAAHIPARNWLRGWLPKQQSATVKQIRNQLEVMAKRQMFRQGPFEVIAERMKSTVGGRITAGQIRPADSAVTLAQKAPETRPLIDTKQFLGAIQGKLTGRGAVRWRFKTK